MDVHGLLRRFGLRPSKGLGQNFLTDTSVLERIVEASELDAHDVVLEIGPGLGLLTRRLAERAATVVAIELDARMVAVLAETLGDCPNVHVLQADILETDIGATLAHVLGPAAPTPVAFKVVANLPYYVTSAVLRHLLDSPVRPTSMTLMVQLEVAQRIVAKPGDLSVLAVSVQAYGHPELVRRVPAGAFYPRPKVDSALLRVCLYPEPRVPAEQRERFFRTVRAGFGQRRKQLHNSLAAGLALSQEQVSAALEAAGIAAERRAQSLSLDEWLRLAQTLPWE